MAPKINVEIESLTGVDAFISTYEGANQAKAPVKDFFWRKFMICPYCNKEAKWCENKEIYGKNFGNSYMCYYCKDCNAYVGCHNNTMKPLGTMANEELRKLRIRCHNFIDPFWKSKKIRRHVVYSILHQLFGYHIHIAESNIDTCKKIISLEFQKLFLSKIRN